MTRTTVLLACAGLLAATAVLVGTPAPPPVKDTTHTVVQPDESSSGGVDLPRVRAPGEGSLVLEGKLSGAYVQAGPSEAFAHLQVRALQPPRQARVPVNLALVVDRSGSMQGQKLADARRAARALVAQLTPQDRLALVHYGTDVVSFPSTLVTEEARARLLAFIDSIQDEGSTNISGGLQEAAAQLRPHLNAYRVSRVLLLSDGQPTTGLLSKEELTSLARQVRAEGMAVSGLGVGEDFNEQLMQGLAEQGGGFYGFLADSARLEEVFTRELQQAAGTVARAVALELRLPAAVKDVEVLGLSAWREGDGVRVPLYDLAGGQSARVVVKLTLEAPEGSGPLELLAARLHYVDVERDGPAEARLALEARVTREAAQVRAHLDREVRVHATRALGARELRAAAEEMKRGNRGAARGLMNNARRIFGASAQALSGELADLERTQAAYESQQDEAAVRRGAMELHRKTMSNFGQENAY